jgi:hypothetical protein
MMEIWTGFSNFSFEFQLISIIMKRILPSIFLYAGMICIAILIDYILHLANLVWVGRYFGIFGTALIIISFIYSLRKRKIINSGQPKKLLNFHEFLGWFGAIVLLVHGGIHFNAIIPWMALLAMMVVVASGLTGKFLLNDVKQDLKGKISEMKEKNLTQDEIDKEVLFQSLLVKKMQNWRKVHMPLNMIFMALALIHIIGTLLLWSWR